MIAWIFLFPLVLAAYEEGPKPSLVEIDNSIDGEPHVQCDSDSISLQFESKNPFNGKIFVKGFVADSACVQMGNRKTAHSFSVKHESCGVRRERKVNGVVLTTTVIVSFHSIFITQVDRAYRLSCFYVEATKKVHQQLDTAALTTQTLENETQLPVCRYEILSEPEGSPIKYARIGDTVYHKWVCDTELVDVYCMRVHSCTVYDGQGGPPVTVIDANGCSLDQIILGNLDYQNDLTATKPAPVFKFADKVGLYFNCQIRLTIKDANYGCSLTQPKCPPTQTYVSPAMQTTEISSEYTDGTHESGYPTRSLPEEEDEYVTSPISVNSSDSTVSVPPGAQLNIGLPSIVPGAPGRKPTYEDLHPASSSTEAPYKNDRLIKRSAIHTGLRQNSSQPVAVADFDLPERGLIVFGIEDSNDETKVEHLGDELARRLFDDKPLAPQMCFANQKLFGVMFFISVLVVAVLTGLTLIIYRQRRMISQPFLKH